MGCQLFLLILLIHWMPTSSTENDTNTESLPNTGNTRNPLLRTSLGQYCWGEICSEHEFCNELLTCQCCPGFKNYNDFCVSCAGENEKCETTFDCCPMLLCIKGICRKPEPNIEFVTLTKVCLATTAIALFIAIFSFLIKCLIRYGKFNCYRQGNVTTDSNSPHDYMMRSCMGVVPPPYDMRREKPPSYEECVRATPRPEYSDPPPPYFVPINVSQIEVSNNSNINNNNNNTQSPAAPITDQQASATTVLNVQSLVQPIIVNPPPMQVLQSEGNLQKVEETRPS